MEEFRIDKKVNISRLAQHLNRTFGSCPFNYSLNFPKSYFERKLKPRLVLKTTAPLASDT